MKNPLPIALDSNKFIDKIFHLDTFLIGDWFYFVFLHFRLHLFLGVV